MKMHKLFVLLLVLAVGTGVAFAAEKAEAEESKAEATKETAEEDKVMSIALESGAEDMKSQEDMYEITTAIGDFEAVKDALANAGIEPESAELTMMPSSTVKLEGQEAKQILALMEMLEDHDDVQNVYANFDIPDELLNEE